MQASEAVQWKMEEWELPPPLPREKTRANLPVCPYVGLKLPYYAREKHLKKAWFSRREMKSWEIQPFRRRALYKLLKRNFNSWVDWLRIDSTPTFYKDMEGFKKRQSGAVIGIAGPKMSGKSRLGQMLLTRLVDTQPHVLFQYKDLEHHIKDRDDLSIAIQIDEDLKATGNESRNLVVHVNNSFETSRKADLWAICTGVNLNFKNWGNTLDLRMIPFGFNTDFQATRAAIFDKESDFLGFCVFQRKHLPEDPVFYYNADGKWGEYEARARAYSRTVTKKGGAQDAVDDITQTKHVETLKLHFKTHYLDKGISLPTDLMCNRLYRQAKLPAKSTVYMKEIIAWAKFELEDGPAAGGGQGKGAKGSQADYKEMTTKGWTDLRAALSKLMKCWPCALYYVPPHALISDREIVEMEGLGIESGSLGTTRRRRLDDIPTSKLGILGEKACVPWLDSLSPRAGTGAKGQADILVDVDGIEVALNIKLTLKKDFKESLAVTPEDRWMPNALAVLLVPRHLRIKVFRITGPVMTLNWRRGVLATPDTLAEVIREMVVSEQ
ncbi:MAG: hypothetical protein KAU10_03210 [Dehalococcoidia bacterium]|nr:hypothetical protein [Dehalococcoidia bacterium]